MATSTVFTGVNLFKSKNSTKLITSTRFSDSKQQLSPNSVKCCSKTTTATTEEATGRLVTVKNGNDSLEICRVLNGMWQTSGGWGRIDRDAAVEAMLRYADAEFLQSSLSNFTLNSVKWEAKTGCSPIRKLTPNQIQCVITEDKRRSIVKNGTDSLEICRVVNGMWQTSGGWGRIDRDNAVDAMLRYADAGLTTFDMADIYGPAEDLYGIFINRVRRERPPEYLEKVRGLTKWVPPPVKMTSGYVRENIDVSRKRMDVPSLDMLQFHWWDYSNPGYLDALKNLTDLKEEDIEPANQDKSSNDKYGTVMGGLLSEKFLDTNLTIPFAGPPLNTPSLQKYKRMVDAWGGWSLFQTLLKTLKTVASKHGVTIPTVAVKYILDQTAVAGSMVGVRLGLSEHIQDTNAIFSLVLDEEDVNSIQVAQRGKDLLRVIGDCGDEYRRA
ncbi:hypothetical protein GOBAR_AA40314 [Gossypium barbadense]|uniref:NADP-dependent oxidoreductase domain-containing protein n=1 Tax=Gossypium barbadense TaxID=3634 RepID=A0A2P5VNI8_GOSBA|nr:hypothetical protein GOBAR_AA40314 [Gossypium barbadense]